MVRTDSGVAFGLALQKRILLSADTQLVSGYFNTSCAIMYIRSNIGDGAVLFENYCRPQTRVTQKLQSMMAGAVIHANKHTNTSLSINDGWSVR